MVALSVAEAIRALHGSFHGLMSYQTKTFTIQTPPVPAKIQSLYHEADLSRSRIYPLPDITLQGKCFDEDLSKMTPQASFPCPPSSIF